MKKIYTKPRRDKKAERIAFLKKYAMEDWIKTREEADEEVSREHSMKCVCGKLCTGLHESYCRKFKEKVDTRTVKKLKHLWEEKKVAYPKVLK
jgi:hypothetical protein